MIRSFSHIVFLLLVLSAVVKPANAVVSSYYYTPECITNISGRVFTDRSGPLHFLNMSVFSQPSIIESQAVTWMVGDFTGVYPSSPIDCYQRGVDNSWYGSCAVQIYCTQMGAMLHTWSVPTRNTLINSQVKYEWSSFDNIHPWMHTDSVFKVSFHLKVPAAYMTSGACGYVYASICLADPNGKYFWLQPAAFDTRGISNSESVGWDKGTSSAYAGTFYGSNTRYISKDPASAISTGTTWNTWRWYCFTIDRTQLLNAVNDINSRYNVGLSSNPAAYRLGMITIQDEIYWPLGDGYVSMGVKDLWAYENYSFTNNATISGCVTSSATGHSPIAGVKMQVSGINAVTITDVNGLYSLSVPAGVYTLSASKIGCDPQSAQVVTTSSNTTTQNFDLNMSAESWDGAGEFPSNTNLAGIWRYGYLPTLGGSFVPYNSTEMPRLNMITQLLNSDLGNSYIGTNMSAISQGQVYDGYVEVGQMYCCPGTSGQVATLRWTAPKGALVKISGKFLGSSAATTDVHVLLNGVSLFNGNVDGYYGTAKLNYSDRYGKSPSQEFNITTYVAKNDTVDFCVGRGANANNKSDLTTIQPVITAIAPATLDNIGSHRTVADGSYVVFGRAAVATCASDTFSDGCFYVEDTNRASGIKIVPRVGMPSVALGDEVTLSGTLDTDANGERVLRAYSIDSITAGKTLHPVGMINKTAQASLASGVLVKTWGKVSAIASDGSYIYVNDGSNGGDGADNTGIRIQLGGLRVPVDSLLKVGDNIVVTGIAGYIKDGMNCLHVIRVRNSQDIIKQELQ